MNTTRDSKTAIDPEQWVNLHGDALYRYARLRVQGPDLAEELVQETFLAGLKAAKSFGSQSAEQTWLIGILKHKIVDCYRKSAREASAEETQDGGEWQDDYFHAAGVRCKGAWKDKPGPWDMAPGTALEASEFRLVLDYCMEGLSRRARSAFVLREIEQMKGQHVCKVLELTKANYWALLHRARMQLRRCLEANWLGRGKDDA